VLRLKGVAGEIQWPARALSEPVARCEALLRAAARYPDPDYAAGDTERREIGAREASISRARLESARRFGSAQSWDHSLLLLHSKRLYDWTYEEDLFRYASWYFAGKKVAAVVVHLYTALDVDKLPRGMIVDELPVSWVAPLWCSAYVLRPPDIDPAASGSAE
jgi:hypothetical protein